MSEEVENTEVETPSVDRLDLLGQVLDANLSGDDDAAKTAFHDYLTMTTKTILQPDEIDGDEVEISADADEPEVEVDDVNVDDIDLDQHIAAVATDEPEGEEEVAVSDEEGSSEE